VAILPRTRRGSWIYLGRECESGMKRKVCGSRVKGKGR
jgi:hypothetical protein